MKRTTGWFRLGMAIAGLLASPAFAQQEPAPVSPSQALAGTAQGPAIAGAYREPLTARIAHAGTRHEVAPPSGRMPQIPDGPTTTERVSTAVLGFAAKSAFSLAAQRTGTGNAVPAPSYAPYRPGLPMPEPGTEAVGCQPNGALTTPMACADR